MKRKFWNPDKIVSISAIFISLLTLVVFIYQTNLMRKQQYLTVLPYLSISNQNTGTPNYRLLLQNDGIGPAFIESMKIQHRGKTYDMDFANFLYQHVPAMDSIWNIRYSNIRSGQMIPAGEEIYLLEVHDSAESGAQLLQLLKKLYQEEFNYEIIYRSIYEERWRLTRDHSAPEKI